MPTPRPPTSRRIELRRRLRAASGKGSPRLLEPEILWSVAYFAALSIFGTLIALSAMGRPLYRPGQVLAHPILARAPFTTPDPVETERRQLRAHDLEPDHYRARRDYPEQVRRGLAELLAAGAAPSAGSIAPGAAGGSGGSAGGPTGGGGAGAAAPAMDMSSDAREVLRGFAGSDAGRARWNHLVDEFISALMVVPILEPQRIAAERSDQQVAHFIHIEPPGGPERDVPIGDLIGADDSDSLRRRVSALADDIFPPELRGLVAAVALKNPQALYEYDEAETQQGKAAAAGAVRPASRHVPAEGVIVRAGQTLTDDALAALRQEQRAFSARTPALDRWLRRLGVLGMIATIGIGLWSYIFTYNNRIVQIFTRGLALTVLLLLCQALAVGFTGWYPDWIILSAGLPTLFAAIVLAIAYDRRLALVAAAVETLLVTVSLDLTIGQTLMLLTGSLVASSLVDEVRTRSKLLEVGLWTGLAMAAAALAADLVDKTSLLHLPLHGFPGDLLIDDALLALGTGLGAGLLVQGLLPLIERVFKVTTALTLKELNDASHPLLRRLAQEAPGTYQHSLRLADIVEAAAGACGANAPLCKVGAMYHDIGKINKPAYFIENQAGGPNRHAKLSPAMSLLILVAHVKDGVELAREYALPPAVRHFIESHHGTTLVEYFYHAARQQRDAHNAPPPDEFEFRYPGPRPQTTEAAILMLGDSIESAVRALDGPTPARIDHLIHQIVNKRLSDGQFHACNLTLRQLFQIQESMTKTLTAMYHDRVKYPSDSAGESTATPAPGVSMPPSPRTA